MAFTRRGSKTLALGAKANPSAKQAALEDLTRDMGAMSATASRGAALLLWFDLHEAWFGNEIPLFPLMVSRITAVAAMLRHGRDRSVTGVLARARDRHIEEFPWYDHLEPGAA